jgi:pSer/pThr/pTyr-binding forkhead associated (FHA) protein
VSELPPLFFPLAKNNEGRPTAWRPAPPIHPSQARAIAMNEPLPGGFTPPPYAPPASSAARITPQNIEVSANGPASPAPHAVSNSAANNEIAASNVANKATVNEVDASAAHVVNNGANNAAANNAATNNAATNIGSNGASSGHVVNGRGGSISFVPPNSGRPNVPPPQINTPTHLKVVRDFSDFADGNAPAPTETVRFRRPTDEAVQLLPGRLEVISGDPRHQEIRFVRIPGRPAELILGREPGDTAQHIALDSSTVSRKHARFAYHDSRWHIVNLSQTNPVVVNGEELMAQDNARTLDDGDQIELGEVVLRFRSH